MGGDKSPAATTASLPKIAGRYHVEKQLGRGGAGAVYLAHEVSGGRAVALKTLEVVTDTTKMLFEREYHVLASLRHPSVIRVFDFGFTDNQQRYYTMEVLSGADIAGLAPLPWKAACVHLRDIAASLSLLHCRRLLHRDVSPRNIRFDADGRAKLIDFGALTSFGVPNEIVGTPICIAPEAVRRGDLDQRSDLYSLGVVFYYALTGEKPYQVRSVRDVEAAVLNRPPAPSTVVSGVPLALDQLILSLLSPESSGRPSSAAEVYERLSAIAGLSDEAGAEVAESHLASTSLCGRDREKEQLKQHLAHANRGQGGVLVVEGVAGMGKSLLVSDTILEGRLRGMTTLYVDALAHTESFGVIARISQGLADAFPDHHAPPFSAAAAVGSALENSAEALATTQNQFVNSALSIASRTPLLIVVDNVHAADAVSLGALSALAHKARDARLMLLVTQLLGETMSPQMQQLARLGARIKLRGLTQAAVVELVSVAFGDAPNGARLAQWLLDVGQGNPGQSIDLLTHLMRQGVIRYSGGAWILPMELTDAAVPRSREQVLRQRIESLDPVALRLARMPAIHRGSLATRVCVRALNDVTHDAVLAALDTLSAKLVIVVTGDQCRIGDELLRALLLEGLSYETIRELHLSLGEALLSAFPTVEHGFSYATAKTEELLDILQAGFHLVHGGQGDKSRRFLQQGGIELARRGEGLSAAIPALERTVEAYEKQGRTKYENASLFVPLTLAGCYVDFRLTYKYGDRLMRTLAEVSGISLAAKLRAFVGGHLGLLVGLCIAAMRIPLTSRRYAARSLGEAMLGVVGIGAAIAGAASSLMDGMLARRTVDLLAPLKFAPSFLPIRTAYEFQLSLLDSALGNYAVTCKRSFEVLARLRQKSWLLPESARQQLEFGVYIVLGNIDAYRTDGRIHQTLEALEGMRTSVSLQTAAGVRAAYHAYRGERPLFERYQREVDVLAAQLGSTWRQDVLIARNQWWTYAICEDVMGLKQCLRSLEGFAEDVPALAASRDAASAFYMATRGQHSEALEKYRDALELVATNANEIQVRFVVTLAHLERLCGNPARAEQRCREALAAFSPDELAFEFCMHAAYVEQILALVDMARLDEAQVLATALLTAQEKHDNPLMHGLTHKTAARVALAMKDADELGKQLGLMGDWFARTENPSLIAQCHTLADLGMRAGVLTDTRAYMSGSSAQVPAEVTAIREWFSRCRGPADRLQVALDVIVASSRAERGYLYLSEADGGFRFAAPLVGIEPPDDLRIELFERLQRLCAVDEDTTAVEQFQEPAGLTTVVESDEGTVSSTEKKCHAIFLLIPRESEIVAVGAVALVHGTQPLRYVENAVVNEITQLIYGAADVPTVYVKGQSVRPPERPASLAPAAALSSRGEAVDPGTK